MGDEADKMQIAAKKLENAGSYEQALEGYQAALEFRKSALGSNNPSTVGCYNNIARLLVAMDDPEKALATCQQAIALYVPGFVPSGIDDNPASLEKVTSLPFLLDMLLIKFDVLSTMGDEKIDATIGTIHLTLSVVDQLRVGHKAEHSKIFWTQKILPFIESALAYSYSHLSDEEQRFALCHALIEKSKAFVLFEATRGMDAMAVAGIPASLREQERDIREKLTETEQFIYQEEKRCDLADVGKLEAWNNALDTYHAEYKQLIHQFEKEYPNYFQLKYEVDIPSLEEIKLKLSDDQSMLTYFMGSSHLYLLLIDKNSTQLVRSGPAAGIIAQAKTFRSQVITIDAALQSPEQAYQTYLTTATSLYARLFPPTISSQLKKEIIIVADGILHYIPFGALLTGGDLPAERNYSALPYFALEKQLSEIPSVSLWMHSQGSPSHRLNYAGFAPSYAHDNSPSGFSALRYNQEEVARAQSTFRGELFVGDACLESVFKSKSSQAGVLHLAMHTVLNDEQPLYSGFIFDHLEDSLNDGVLTIGEIYNLELQAQLVVLSSCNTGSGELVGGEGVMSLARAFSFAGCPSIIMSLWECEDQSTKKMVGSFVDHLKEGQQKSLALQNAQRDYLAQAIGNEGHPFYWSGLMIVGSDVPLSNEISAWWSAAVAVVLLLAGIRFMRRRTQRSPKS